MKTMQKETLKTFEMTPAVIQDFLSSVPAEKLDVKRNENTWTVREHFYHIVNIQEMLTQRFVCMIEEDDPVIKPFFPENETIIDYSDMDEAFQVFRDYRERQIELIAGLPDESVFKPAVHEEYSNYSVYQLVNHIIFHEYWHLYRIEEIAYMREAFFH